MGPRPHLCICACKTASLPPELTSLYGSQTSPVVFACKQRLLDQNYKSLLVLDLTCRFVDAPLPNSVLTTRINSLYGSQTSPVDLCMQNSDL